MNHQTVMWAAFAILMTIMLVVDLGSNRGSSTISFGKALVWSAVWVGLAMAFNAGIWFTMGSDKALEFLTGYLIEKSLSVDNLFVFIMIFSAFGIRGGLQAKVLKWGIIGAIVLRVVFIVMGSELLEQFQWLFYIFGGLLIYTAVKMAFGAEAEINPENNLLVRLARRYIPVTTRIRGTWFITRKRGAIIASPLLIALLVIESSDLVFALDSIPAIFAITLDPFIVLTSNLFAIMGLRALYFLLAGVLDMFWCLKYAISFILAFVGGKMIAGELGFHLPINLSLTVIAASLSLAVAFSVASGDQKKFAELSK